MCKVLPQDAVNIPKYIYLNIFKQKSLKYLQKMKGNKILK